MAETAIQELKAKLRGELLTPESPSYDDIREVWNAMIDRRPALIARCAGTADVMHALEFARNSDLLVSVRSGGHNIAGNALCDGGLMIDLSPMKSVRINPKDRRAFLSRLCQLLEIPNRPRCPIGTVTHLHDSGSRQGINLRPCDEVREDSSQGDR